MASRQVEEYLEAIGRLEEHGTPVTTSAVAEACGVTAPTATEMLTRLAERGYITRTPRREAKLTDAGRAIASTVLRRHRLWERFLSDVLGLRWDSVHEQACALEHDTSPELEQWLADAVASDPTCPHGHAIPGLAPAAQPGVTMALSALQPGEAARVISVSPEETELLRRLGALGILPDAVVRRPDAASSEDDLALIVGDQLVHLDQASAESVAVQPISPDEDQPLPIAGAQVVPLSALATNEAGAIQGYRGGRGIMGRCLALGFTPGARIEMLHNTGQGPIIVLVRDTRVALGRGEAGRIMVRRGDSDGANG